MRTFEIYFADLSIDAMDRLCDAFDTTSRDENWETQPLATIEREENPDDDERRDEEEHTN